MVPGFNCRVEDSEKRRCRCACSCEFLIRREHGSLSRSLWISRVGNVLTHKLVECSAGKPQACRRLAAGAEGFLGLLDMRRVTNYVCCPPSLRWSSVGTGLRVGQILPSLFAFSVEPLS